MNGSKESEGYNALFIVFKVKITQQFGRVSASRTYIFFDRQRETTGFDRNKLCFYKEILKLFLSEIMRQSFSSIFEHGNVFNLLF